MIVDELEQDVHIHRPELDVWLMACRIRGAKLHPFKNDVSGTCTSTPRLRMSSYGCGWAGRRDGKT